MRWSDALPISRSQKQRVVRLSLDDIDWQAGTIRITLGKGRRADVLPLPGATGEAIADYLLHERPKTTCRQIFVRHVAPLGEPVGRRVVQKAVHAAYQRLGWNRTRVHILRHTLATRVFARSHAISPISIHTPSFQPVSFRSFKTPARPAIGRQNGRRIALQWGSVAPAKVKPIDSHPSRSGSLRGYWATHPACVRDGRPQGGRPACGASAQPPARPHRGTPNCSLDELANTDNGGCATTVSGTSCGPN